MIEKSLITSFRFLTIVLPLLIFLLLQEVNATCGMSKEAPIRYYTSLEKRASGLFSSEMQQSISTYVNRCGSESGKFLMLTLGAARANYYSDVFDISTDGKLFPNICTLEGLPVARKLSFADNQANMLQNYQAIRSCLFFRVEDIGGQILELPQNQTSCKVRINNPASADVTGDFCFFKIKATSEFKITPLINPECENGEFYNQNKINPQDVQSVLNIYVTGDSSGMSSEINPVGSRQIHWHLQPPNELMSLISNFENEDLKFPAEYNVDTHLGEVEVKSSSLGTDIYLSNFIQNLSLEKCIRSLCSSPSWYLHPVFEQVDFFERDTNGKFEIIDTWYGGGYAQPAWEGLMKIGTHHMSGYNIREGHQYKIELTLTDPLDDYLMYLNWAKQMLIRLPEIGENSDLQKLEVLAPLQQLRLISSLPALPAVGSAINLGDLQKIIADLNKLVGSRAWPDSYELVCDPLRINCIRSASRKYHTKIIFEFKVGPLNPQTKAWKIEEMITTKDSPIFQKYRKILTQLPYLKCGS